MQLDGYMRVSKMAGRGGESFHSFDQQRDGIERWAKERGHTIAAWWEEEDVSGGKTKRPMLDQVMARIEAGETGGIVVLKFDRFARSLIGGLSLLDRITAAGGKFASVQQDLDTTTEQGEFFVGLMLLMGEFELKRIRANWRDVRGRANRRGVYMGYPIPFGYLRVVSSDGPDDPLKPGEVAIEEAIGMVDGEAPTLGSLIPDPQAAPTIRQIFERRAAGEGWGAIRDWLNGEGIPTSTGHPWTTSTLSRLVKGRIYLGELHEGVSGGALLDAHEPLIDPATFATVQRRRPARVATGATTNPLLQGLVRCGSCSYTMASGATRRDPSKGLSLTCTSKSRGHSCSAPASVIATDSDRATGLNSYVIDKALERAAAYDVDLEVAGNRKEVERLTRVVERARQKHSAYVANREVEIDAVGHSAWLDGAEDRRRAVEDAERDLRNALSEGGGELRKHMRSLRDDWAGLSEPEQHQAIAALVQAVFVFPANTERKDRGAKRECSEDGCDRPHRARGYCSRHYQQHWSRGELVPVAGDGPGFGASDSRVVIAWFDDPTFDSSVHVPRQGKRTGFVPWPALVNGDHAMRDPGSLLKEPGVVAA